MPETIRTAAMRVNRPRSAGQAASGANDVFGEGFSLTGRVNNLVLSNVVPGVATPYGQIGPVNWWDRTVSLTDTTFDSFEMNEAPVALGPGFYIFDILTFTDLLIGDLPQRVRYQVGGIILPEHGTFDRNNADNRSMPVVIKATLLVVGGGSGIKAHREGITKPDHGVSGDQYPFGYCDLAGAGGSAVWITKSPGLAAVQWLPLRSM